MKLYSLTNSYQSGVQVGIQTQHAVTRLLQKYRPVGLDYESSNVEMVQEWATEHETTIILRAGGHHELQKIHNEILAFGDYFEYPHSYFQEEGLNDSYTSVCFILDQYALDAMAEVRAERDDSIMHQHFPHGVAEFMLRIMKLPLAV